MDEIQEKWGEGGEMERKVWIFLLKLLIPIAAVIMLWDWLK